MAETPCSISDVIVSKCAMSKSRRFFGCTAIAVASVLLATAAPAAAAEIKAVATIKPVHALLASVMSGIATPELLVKGNASPHTYALKPSDAKVLNDADVVFRVAETIEPFTQKIVTALPAHVRVVTLIEAPDISLLAARQGGTFEAHHHDHNGPHDDHDDDGDEDRHPDGHIWLDPENAKALVREMARVLSEIEPDHAAAFNANAARTITELETLTSRISSALAPLHDRPFVVFHDAYQYFERRFGLKAVGSITISPEVPPSAKRLSDIRSKLSKLEAACVFAEPQFQSSLVAAVIEGTSAHAGTLDPEGALVDPGPAGYVTLLDNLARGLSACLAPAK